MSARRIIVVITVYIVAAFVLVAGITGPAFFSELVPDQEQPSLAAAANPVVAENAQAGTLDWQIAPAHESVYQIQAYAGATSVTPGSSIDFYVSTQTPGNYTIDIYRMGWYGGTGARLMTSIPNNVGENQGFYDVMTQQLVCPATKCPLLDKHTGLFEVHWDISYTLTVPLDWTSGVYLAKFTDSQGWQTYAPFDVLGNFTSTYVVVTPDTTAEAYNLWGGPAFTRKMTGMLRSIKVFLPAQGPVLSRFPLIDPMRPRRAPASSLSSNCRLFAG